MKLPRIHKGWIILVVATLNVFASLGLARFSFGVILPYMRESLMLSYTQVGIITSAMFFGYLLSAVFVGSFINRYKEKIVLITSLVITAIGMMISVFSIHFLMVYIACLIIGVGSGAGNMTSLALVNNWFKLKYRGMALGITNSGSGLGMVFSGFVLPLFMIVNNDGWRVSWGVLALCVIFIIIMNVVLIENDPKNRGLSPIGADLKVSESNRDKGSTPLISNIYRNKYIIMIGLIYFTWGFSYLIFSTFLVDFLISDIQFDMNVAGQIFAIVGITSIISGFIWASLSDKIGRMLTLFLVYFIQTILLLAFALFTHPLAIIVATVLYALTLWAVPTVIVAVIGDVTVGNKVSMAIGYITLFFGIGQWISPIISGPIIDLYSFSTAFLLSATICCIGSIGCICLHFILQKNRSVNEGLQEAK